MTGWTIYWLTRLDAIHDAASIFATIIGIVLPLFLVFGTVLKHGRDFDNYDKVIGKQMCSIALRILAPCGAVMVCVLVFLPTLKEAAAIIVIPKLAASEELQGLGQDMVALARDWMKELEPKHEESK